MSTQNQAQIANCTICDYEFIPKSHNAMTCSNDCRKKNDTLRNSAYFVKKYSEDINFRLAANLRSRINKVIKKELKVGSAVNDLGCSINDLKKHLEQQFKPGMSWYNYSEWHIDHIRPLSSFDLTDAKEFKKACHYSNLQPLWAEDNLLKGSNWRTK